MTRRGAAILCKDQTLVYRSRPKGRVGEGTVVRSKGLMYLTANLSLDVMAPSVLQKGEKMRYLEQICGGPKQASPSS